MSDDTHDAAELLKAARDAGMTPADYLRSPNTPDHPPGEAHVTARECNGLRRRLADGASVRQLTDSLAYAHSTIRSHAKGLCAHDSTAPPVTYDHDRQTWESVCNEQ